MESVDLYDSHDAIYTIYNALLKVAGTRSACGLLMLSPCFVLVRSLIVIILLYYIIDCRLDF